MKITQDVRDYAAKQGVDEASGVAEGHGREVDRVREEGRGDLFEGLTAHDEPKKRPRKRPFLFACRLVSMATTMFDAPQF